MGSSCSSGTFSQPLAASPVTYLSLDPIFRKFSKVRREDQGMRSYLYERGGSSIG